VFATNLGLIATALVLLLAPASASAFTEYGYLGEFGAAGTGEGQFNPSTIPQRLAVSQSTGYVYVADTGNNRIEAFKPAAAPCSTECAEFVTKFGEGVLSRPVGVAIDDESGDVYATSRLVGAVDEEQEVALTGATGGTYKLSFEGQATGWTGEGKLESESKTITEVSPPITGTLVVGEFISGSGIKADTEIIAYNEAEGEITLNKATKETVPATKTPLSADLAAGAGEFEVEEALEALSTIGAGNVVASGSFGGPWTVKFKGKFTATDVPTLLCDAAGLTPIGATCAVATTKEAAAAIPGKIVKFTPDNAANPTAYAEDATFTSPAEGTGPEQVGNFGAGNEGVYNTPGIAVGSEGSPCAGDLWIADTVNNRVDHFSSAGAFLSSFDGTGGGGSAFVEPVDIAVNSACDLIVADGSLPSARRVTRYNAADELQATMATGLSSNGGIDVAADPATDEVFIARNSSLFGGFGVGSLTEYAADANVAALHTDEDAVKLNAALTGLAVGGGRVYLDASNPEPGEPRVQVWEEAEVTPPTVTVEAPLGPGCLPGTEPTITEACFRGTVNPNGSKAAWRFEYRKVGAATWIKAPVPDGDAGEGVTAEPVQFTVGELAPNTEYEVRLSASNFTSTVLSALPNPTFTTQPIPPAPPTLGEEKAWSVSDTTATLAAELNIHFNSELIDCHFEFGPTEAYDQTAPCSFENGTGEVAEDPNEFPADGESHPVTANIAGLSANTAYHFRLVADNGTGGPQQGDDAGFETRPPFSLPRRGYELVSALDTNGIQADPNMASPDGDHYVYYFTIPVPGSQNGGAQNHLFRASRRPGGSWTQRYVGPPPGVTGTTDSYFSEDLSVAVWPDAAAYDPADQNGAKDIYRSSLDEGSPTWLSCSPELPAATCPPSGPPLLEASRAAESVQYVSPDGGQTFFSSVRDLLPEDKNTSVLDEGSLYEWNDGQLRLVAISPGSTDGFTVSTALGSRESGGSDGRFLGSTTSNAVSRDGSRIVFQSRVGIAAHLYVRLNGEKTVEASVGEGVSPAVTAPTDVNYWGADAEDQSVFFTSTSRLTPGSGAVDAAGFYAAGDSPDLYRYVVPADGAAEHGELIDLTPKSLLPPGEEATGAGVTEVLDVSDDGARVYFAANGALAPGASPGNCFYRLENTELKGSCNLYLAEMDSHGLAHLTFIAHGTLAVRSGGTEGSFEAKRDASATPDGSYLAFRSLDPLVPGRRTGGLPQVFLYDAARGELGCASCPPDGSVPSSPATTVPENIGAPRMDLGGSFLDYGGTVKPGDGRLPRRPAVALDGAVFFQSFASLLPADSSGKTDVYEYRSGKLRLISSGLGSYAGYAGSSTDGSTVFLRSAGAYVRGVAPGIVRIYAACDLAVVANCSPEPPLPTPPCTGEDCKPVATPQPNYATPATGTIVGRGNVVGTPPARCPKGKVKRNGRCVAKHHKRHSRAANHIGGAGR
jgi:hypothetical protein